MSLIEALRDYRPADDDGVMVIVSRQACDEAADALERVSNLPVDEARTEIARLTAERDKMREALEAIAEERWNADVPPLAMVSVHEFARAALTGQDTVREG